MAQHVQLFGDAKLHLAKQSVPFLADRRYQLLAYLGYQGDWVNRENLQYLFWADTSDKHAKDNFRQLLRRVRALEHVKNVMVERQRLCWHVESDVKRFKAALAQEQWARALELYQGPFLQGLEAKEESEFATWLTLERDRLRTKWRFAILMQSELLAAHTQYLEATVLLNQLLEGDELDEEALIKFMRFSFQAGGREQALKAYKAFSKRLKEEMGLTPTSALAQLAEQIHTEQYAIGEAPLPEVRTSEKQRKLISDVAEHVPIARTISLTKLPTASSSFVGRDVELADIIKLLAEPDCRLLNVTGFGGVGKTRLAVKAAEQLQTQFQDGTVFVRLEAVTSADSVPPAIAAALGFSLYSSEDAFLEIISVIGDKELLLVLDNFEHLLEGAVLAQAMVEACPKLKLLVTSRERLNVEAEWLLPLGGLAYLENSDVSLAEALQYDAPRLFVERVKRVKPDLRLEQSDVRHLLNICKFVEGSPLGLELAAVWIRLLPLRDIAAEIQRDISFLNSHSRSKVERHQSLRAVCERSWQLLSPHERTLLRKLAVFRGGFDLEAAKQVVGASLAGLASLVDKSLLKVLPGGRYDRHMLIYQYSREKLTEQPDEQQEIEVKHGHYFLNRLVANQDSGGKAAFRHVAENVRAAWHWAAKNEQIGLLKRCYDRVSFHFIEDMRYQEGYDAFDLAVSHLVERTDEEKSTLALLLSAQAFHAYKLGKTHQSKELALRGLALANSTNNLTAKAHALSRLSTVCVVTGDYLDAKRYLIENFEMAKKALPTWPKFYSSLAYINIALGNYGEAQQNVQEAYHAHEANHLTDSGYLILCQAEIYFQQDKFREARALLLETLEQKRVESRRICEFYISLMRTAYELGDYEEANEYLRLANSTIKGKSSLLKYNHDIKLLSARLATARGDLELAKDLFEEALREFWRREQLPSVLGILCFFAEWLLKQQQNCDAVTVFSLTESYPKRASWIMNLSQKHLESLSTIVEETAFKAAKESGQTLDPKVFVPTLLANWPHLPDS